MSILSIEEARSKIREIIQGHGTVLPSLHCRSRMIDRNVQMDDILYCLYWGNIEYGNDPGDEENNIFRIPHEDIEGEPLTVVVQIDIEENRLICLTVF